MQTDHINTEKNVTEETDPAKLAPNNWEAWFNHVFLPETAKKYNVELLDQRAEWKRYLTTNNLKPSQLLSDGVHLNDWGNYAMAEFVKAHLRYDPKFSDAPHKDLMREYKVGTDIKWTNGKLTLPFEGNRVDVMRSPTKNAASRCEYSLMARSRRRMPELYAFTRPAVHRISVGRVSFTLHRKRRYKWKIGRRVFTTSMKTRPNSSLIHRFKNRPRWQRHFRCEVRFQIGPHRHRAGRLVLNSAYKLSKSPHRKVPRSSGRDAAVFEEYNTAGHEKTLQSSIDNTGRKG
jgi:hypothetical protein